MASRNIVIKNNTCCFKSALQKSLDFSFLVKNIYMATPFFFFVYRPMRFLILGRSVGFKKKKPKKKITRSLGIVGFGTQGRRSHIWIKKMYNILWKIFMFLFLVFSMLLLCSFFRLKELFQVKNGVTMSLLFFFFWKCQKFGSVGRTTVNGEKKEDGLFEKNYLAQPNIHLLPGAWCDHFLT